MELGIQQLIDEQDSLPSNALLMLQAQKKILSTLYSIDSDLLIIQKEVKQCVF